MAELKASKEAKFVVTIPNFDNNEAINQFDGNISQVSKMRNSEIKELTNTEEKFGVLRISNERIFDSVGDAILVIDPNDYQILSANKAASKQLKLRREDLIGKKCYEVTHRKLTPCKPPHDVCPIKEMLITGKSTTVEHQHFDQENRRIDVEVSVHPVKDNAGKIIQIVHIDRDITSRKKLEREEKTKSDEIRAIIDGIGDMLFVMDKNRIITEVNKSTCEVFKKKTEELVGKHCYEIVHGTDCPWPSCPATKTFETKQIVTEEVNDSNLGMPLLVTTSPILDEKGEIDKIIHIAKDISKMKLAEMELHIAANLFDAASDSILVHEMDGKLVYFNEAAYKTRGYTRDEFQGLNIKDLEAPENPKFFRAQLSNLMNNGEATFEVANLRKDKTAFTVEVNARVIESDGRKLVLSVSRDISKRKQAEEALQKSEKEYSSLFDNMINGFAYCQMLFDENGKPDDFVYLQINHAFEKITGLNRDLIVGKKVTEAIPGIKEENPQLFEIYGRVALTGQKEKFDIFFKPLSMWLSISVYCPRKGYFAAIFENIAERKEAEEKLANLKEFDERIIDSLDDALLVIDPDDYKIISTNEVALKQLKLKKEELIGKTCYETTHHSLTPCNSAEHLCPIRRVLETKETITVEHKHFDENNIERVVEVSARLVKNPEGKTVIIHVARDITERKQMETRIIEAEKRYRALFDQAPVSILIIDPETAVPVEFNEVAHQQLGYSRKEFEKLRIFDYKSDETPDETRSRIEKVLREGGVEFETKHRTKNGEIRYVVATSQVIELSGKKFVHSIYRDVTDAKKVENALMESEAKYRLLVELAQEGVWALDKDSTTVFVNPRMAKMLGYSESEMMGKKLVTFLSKPDSDLAQHNLEGCKLGNQGECEFEFIQKDGAHMFANIAASSINDDVGNYIGTLALVADITERKKMEVNLKESRDKLEIMNEKLGVVGSLTRHDVRNKLSAVTGYAYILKKKHSDLADVVDGLSRMEQAVAESVKIFDFAKMYEQLGAEELTYVKVDEKLNEAVALFSGSFPTIINECQGLTVLADSFLRQLFFNFVDNTRKYGKKTTTIRVHFEKTDKDSLKLVYEDDGMGIPFENKAHLFKEGFSTGGSTGFGLFLTRKMMDVYRWTIEETGEPGKGARFTITIPKMNQNGQENYHIA